MNRLASVQAKIKRAQKHIQELDVALKAFFDTNPYVVGAKRDPQTRKPIYYLVSVKEVDTDIAAIAGNVLQDLRSALDHLAYQLVQVGTGRPGPFTHVYFPIFDSATRYEAGKLAQTKGMRQDAIDTIDAVKPYKGGNDTLWRLHRLTIVDKHRLLVTVGSYFQSVDIGPIMQRELKAFAIVSSIALPPLFLRSADRLYPLKAGDELFVDAPNAKVNEKLQFRFDVALSEPQVVEGEPLLETLQQMLDLVGKLVPTFEPLLI
jgi:hypothetical protein